ncbi:hypothetical protein [Methylobacter sp.]|uniref:hypothetical protein n=1 Tax=Methylobacter sp. TaxID=2051955 RepID=UPI00121A8993|nr:hypothetical protein [Methylobacter sp.]TAK63379.1 MAG: hypothetical protein EPO18_07180 [Methylobacter sp.]
MKLILKLIVLTIFLSPLILIGALTLVVENEPKLHDRADLTPEKIAHGKRVFEQNDPRRIKSNSIAKADLGQEELDLAINYLANQYAGGVAGLDIVKGHATVESTLQLPANPLGRFVNLKLGFKQTDKLPQIDNVMLGKLWVPNVLVDMLLNYGLSKVQTLTDWQTFISMIKNVKFEHRRMTVTYRWQDDLPGKLSGVLLSAQDQSRIEVYHRRLAELTQGGKSSLNLTELTKPLFQLAQERSDNGDAVEENRAVILALTFYANQRDLNKLIPQSKTWPRPVWRTITLNGRDDFPKHFLVSSMLAAYSGTPLSNAVGLFKEIEDSRGGSGFSFNDIAADRAGTRAGELLIGNEPQAKKIQMLMASANERDIMPMTTDLPEFMPEAEFKRRFGGLQGGPYRQMMREIERRVEALPINRN